MSDLIAEEGACYVEGCSLAEHDESPVRWAVEAARRSEQVRLHLVALKYGVHLSEVCYGELLAAQAKQNRSAMLERQRPSDAIAAGIAALLRGYEQDGDAEGMLWTMLEAERIGLAYWDEDDWRWR